MTGNQSTALGVARARFVDGLPRKARELAGAVALLSGSPDAQRPREEMRRRLHALYASAQVFRIEPLAAALKENIQRLDRAREEHRALTQGELDELAQLAAALPTLGGVATEGPSLGSSEASPSTRPSPSTSTRPSPSSRPSSRPSPSTSRDPSPSPSGSAGGQPVAGEGSRGARTTQRGFPRPASQPPRRPSFTAAPGHGSGRPSTLPGAPLEMILSVLVIDDEETQASVAEALPLDRYELIGAADPEEALRLARSGAPDIILVAAAFVLGEGADLISRLRSDPLTDFVPIVLLQESGAEPDVQTLREHGVDATASKPIEGEALRRLIDRLAGGAGEPGPVPDLMGDATVEEIAERLAREIHRGIVEAAARGRDVKVALGDGSELLAAAWSTIARVRAEIAEASHGEVRFRDGAARGGPAFMSLVDEGIARVGTAADVSLEGRRVIVADDDPAVVWFFAGLLREEGAVVVEVEDGVRALEEARRRRPDVILSDILMPRMDGLALTRELQRDPALAEVPVILLSWKEDFLQRMRELQAGASGYLRKEAASAQILHKVREVLRPRARLEAQLRAGGEVRGRVEGLGVLALLTTVGEARPDARVSLRDAWNLFEVDFHGGRIRDVTRTATDGSFSRGERALPQLLGMRAGRFTVSDEPPARGGGPILPEAALQEAVQRLGAFVDAVSGARLAKVARVRFDEELLAGFLRASPGATRALVERIVAGESPRDVLVGGEVAPLALENALVDLARRGILVEVRGEHGEDLVAAALAARGGARGPKSLDSAVSETPPAPPEGDALAVAGEGGAEPCDGAAADVDSGAEAKADVGGVNADVDADVLADADAEELLRAPTNPPPSLAAPPEPPVPEEVGSSGEEAAGQVSEGEREKEPEHREDDRDAAKEDGSEEDGSEEDGSEKDGSEKDGSEEDGSEEDGSEEDGGLGALGFVMLLLAFATAGYVGTTLLRGAPSALPAAPSGIEEAPSPPAPPSDERAAESAPEPSAEGSAAEGRARSDGEAGAVGAGSEEGAAAGLGFGQDVPRILDSEVQVEEDQGLLMVQRAGGAPVEVRVRRVGEDDYRELGAAPVAVALPEGRYEIVFADGDDERYRYAFVAAGHTRVVRTE